MTGDWKGFITVEEARDVWRGKEQQDELLLFSALEALLAMGRTQGWDVGAERPGAEA